MRKLYKYIVWALPFFVLGFLLLFSSVRGWLMGHLGPFHLVLLHFPIGLLVMAWLMETATRLGVVKLKDEAIQFVLGIGTVFAVVTAITGWIHSASGGFDSEMIFWHQWTGIGTAVLAGVTFYLKWKHKGLLYFLCFTGLVALLVITGHLGGSLTHGEGFLTQGGKYSGGGHSRLDAGITYDNALVWDHVVQPILTDKCASCHNPAKQKGDLVLTTVAGVQAGGASGAVLRAGKPMESRLVEVVHLPEADDLHMPPAGKPQLTEEEAALISWWIESGASFEAPVAELEMGEEIHTLLVERLAPKHPIDLLGIELPEPALIAELNADGYRITQPDDSKPWVTVNLSDRKDLEKSTLKALRKIADQVTVLDLGNTNVDDRMLSSLPELPHLLQLKLDQTVITRKGIIGLPELTYLESLNVYGTSLATLTPDDLSSFPQLQKLYLFDTKVQPAALEELASQLPSLEIIQGDMEAFPKQAMMPPEFTEASPFFRDSLVLPLSCPYPGAEIRYTLDGTEPVADSPLLTKSSLILNSCTVKAKAFLSGWEPSEAVSESFVLVAATPVSVKPAVKASAKFPGGPDFLFDNKLAEPIFTDKKWMGWWGEDFVALIDLGEVKPVKGVAVHCLEDINSWILYPTGIEVKAGNSPGTMTYEGAAVFELTQQEGRSRTRVFTANINPVEVRYLQIEVEHFGKLPEWHKAAGEDAWLFLDELAVY